MYHVILYYNYCNTLYHIIMYCIVSYEIKLYHTTSFYLLVYCMVLYRIVLYHNRIAWHCFSSCHIASCRIVILIFLSILIFQRRNIKTYSMFGNIIYGREGREKSGEGVYPLTQISIHQTVTKGGNPPSCTAPEESYEKSVGLVAADIGGKLLGPRRLAVTATVTAPPWFSWHSISPGDGRWNDPECTFNLVIHSICSNLRVSALSRATFSSPFSLKFHLELYWLLPSIFIMWNHNSVW